eukprot:CAMPEP_0170960428 /NCGR_PEP_ID=MMETSP0735-20130129/37221_1 /TAXON_ID=186038 /ORGANISM="Fragilariopsis kerguelensis, Strain L26-C5" /LENGTH=289 /DNA_ID=CAMNT_0011375393 /DNA_START=147 /DNA_END=1013 /DNA_ORIENTATION=-
MPAAGNNNQIGAHKFEVTPQAIIFDIDGTLVDSWKLGYDATLVVLKNNQLPLINEETYHEGTRYSTPQRLARHAGLEPSSRITTPATIIDDNENENKNDDIDDEATTNKENDMLFEQMGNKLGAEFDELYVGLVSTQTAGLYPGIKEVLERISSVQQQPSIKMGCFTNACVAYAHAVLKVNDNATSNNKGTTGVVGLQEMMRAVQGADTVPAAKPEPDGLYQVCEELHVPPGDAVYIGDSPSDALAASAAGMPSIGVTWGSHSIESLQKAPFTFYASTPHELCHLLNLL